jgi:hypothetical protein
VSAVRCGSYKAHYYIKNTRPGATHSKTTTTAGVQAIPVLFDLDADLSESSPIPASSAAYKTAMHVVLF